MTPKLLVPLLLSGLLLSLTSWVGWRYFSGKKHKFQEFIENHGAASSDCEEGHQAIAARCNRDQTPLLPCREKMDRIAKNHHGMMIFSSLLITLISLIIYLSFLFNEKHEIKHLKQKAYSHHVKIKSTLEEEVLVPPPPLPPEAFVDAVVTRPGLHTANRDWGRLNPAFVQQVLRLMDKLATRGYPMTLLEGYRSPERQDALAGQATLVTKAKGGQSKHQYGLAVDLAPLRNGKIVISAQDPWAMAAYQALGEEARAAGLTWGGVWRFRDYGHIEKSGPLRQQQGQ